MNIRRLVFEEVRYRRGPFLLAAAAVAAAVACLLSTLYSLRSYDAATDAIVQAKEQATSEEMAQISDATAREMDRLEDEMRKIMKGLGFNVYILPEGQDLGEVYSEGYASKTMPEEYVDRLAQSEIIIVNHLLPSLTRKVFWPEHQRNVLIVGIRGEIPQAHADPKKPLVDPVAPGEAVLGYELHRGLGIEAGATFELMGRRFTAAKLHDERGSVDDITIWLNLSEAQAMLDMKGRINAILALECNCFSDDAERLAEVRTAIASVLPGTTVIEKGSQALARAEARQQARRTAEAQLAEVRRTSEREIARTRQMRDELKKGREVVAAVLLPLILILAVTAVAYLTYVNARERTGEIGILQALGATQGTILAVLLSKAILMGGAGAFAGACIAFVAAPGFANASIGGGFLAAVPLPDVILTVIAAPVIAACAAWLPAFAVSTRDPAEVLRHD